ncbi:RidA family protein [Exilibacterium tricleocarpae]|uniref:RidA family protein n=1 Tax=Exilibacterium tricleocarpae TaxID=2591008 RepID=A0A545TZJ0_9GAMM|nr:RidA family protein [Exilibacterium tricleocarpae]TQV82629.1 RidA family protein [Exilibacterium tricleocarpae]
MKREPINPDTLYGSVQYGFSHAVKSRGTTTIHCAGQVAWDKDYNVVGAGDIGAQARQAFANLKTVLAAAGAGVADVVCMRTYVVNHKPEYLEPVGAAIAEFYGAVTPAANTWIGVQSLALPEFLIEIEVTAEID